MTLTELIAAVKRDMAEVAPKLYWNVEFIHRHWAHVRPSGQDEIAFRVYHEASLPNVPSSGGTFYDGRTPQEAYDRFFAAISQPAQPSLAEVMELIDTPVAGEIGGAA